MHARWIAFIHKFDFVIKYKIGTTNKVVDALSRKVSLLTIISGQVIAFDHLPALPMKMTMTSMTFGHNVTIMLTTKIFISLMVTFSRVTDYAYRTRPYVNY